MDVNVTSDAAHQVASTRCIQTQALSGKDLITTRLTTYLLALADTESTYLLIFMLATDSLGRLLPSRICDRYIGPLNTVIPSAFSSGAAR